VSRAEPFLLTPQPRAESPRPRAVVQRAHSRELPF
jgi:hypothetical protein